MPNTPVLDLIQIDSHNPNYLNIGDVSFYPNGWNIVNPTLQISGAGFQTVSITFVPNSINVINSYNLGITDATLAPIPDGIYTMTYLIAGTPPITPVTKNFIRVYQLQQKFDKAFLTLDIMQCNGPLRRQQEEELLTIYLYIQGAISAANNCALDLAVKLYNKADKLLDQLNKT